MSDDVKDAAAMSTYISNHLPVHVCAICGVYRGLADLQRVQATQLPMHLLRADGPGINGRAPAALTLCCIDGIKYCLAHEGVSATANSPCTFVMSPAPLSVQSAVFACSLAHVSLAVCSQHCLPALLRSKVPRFSLVAFDAGRVPPLPDMLPLSPVEELAIAPLRVHRVSIICRAPSDPCRGRTRDTYGSYLQGHLVAIPNVPADAWKELISPVHPDALAELVDVVLLSHARTEDEALQMARRVRAVQIRPRVVVAWVRWLSQVYSNTSSDLALKIDGAALRYYEQQSDIHVPVACASNVYAIHDELVAGQASSLADGIRAGYADARSDHQHATMDRIVHLQLDYSPTSHVVTEQLSSDAIDDVLRLWPCVLQLPARPHPTSRDVLLPAGRVAVSSIHGEGGYQHCLDTVAVVDRLGIIQQLDTHVKAVVKHVQLSIDVQSHEHVAGIEDVSMVVDGTAHMSARLPVALETLLSQHATGTGANLRTSSAVHVAGAGSNLRTSSAVLDTGAGSELRTQDANASRVANLLSGTTDENGTLGIVAASADCFLDYDRRWPALTHPSVFPYGQGTPPTGTSYEAWLPIILQRAPREQHAQQPLFVLDMFNVIQRHQVNAGARQMMIANESLLREFAQLTNADLLVAAQLLSGKSRGSAWSKAMNEAPLLVRKFVGAIKRLGGNVCGSPAYYASARSQAIALWHALGPFTAFPTYNPSELHSPSALKLLGFDVHYDADNRGVPTDMPNMVARWRAAAANPVACAQFFKVYRDAVWQVLYGWQRGTTGCPQQQQDCRFGRLRAVVDRAEHSSRGALHCHMLVAHSDLQPERLLKLQQGALPQLIQFVQQLSCKHLPANWYLPESASWVARGPQAHLAVDFKDAYEDRVLGVCYKLPVVEMCSSLPLDDNNVRLVKEFVARLSSATQLHHHSHRCKKGGRRGDDMDCNQSKPELTRPAMEILPGGTMLLKCDHGMMVPYCPPLLLVEGCNHAIMLCCDAGKWNTEKWRAEAEGRPHDVTPPSLELHAAQAASYVLKYVTKKPQEAGNLLDTLSTAASASGATRNLQHPTAVHVGRQKLVRTLNAILGKNVVPQSLAALHLCNFGDIAMTHKVAAYSPASFATYMARRFQLQLGTTANHPVQDMPTMVFAGDNMHYIGLTHDYHYRAPSLHTLPAYFYHMCFQKVKASDGCAQLADDDGALDADNARRRPRFALATQHPQHTTHVIALRTELHLPQASNNYPARPATDASADDKQRYAVAVLSMFMADVLLERLLHLGYSLWQIFEAWDQDCEFDVLFAAVPSSTEHRTCVDVCFPAATGTSSKLRTCSTGLPVQDGFAWVSKQRPLPPLQAALTTLKHMSLSVPGDCSFDRWHRFGVVVVKNIPSWVAANAEDRRRTAILHRGHLRKAGQTSNVDDNSVDDDDSEEDDSEPLDMEADEWQVFGEQPVPDCPPNELMDMLLDVTSDQATSQVTQYCATALSMLPVLDGTVAVGTLRNLSPTVLQGPAQSKQDWRELLTSADLTQLGHAQTIIAQGTRWCELPPIGRVLISHISLLEAGAPVVQLKIAFVRVQNSGDVQHTLWSPLTHGPPPDIKMSQLPSMQDTIKLFTLCPEQAFAFIQLGDAMLLECRGTKHDPPLRMVLAGEPGTGKSQVLKAFQWFALQHDASSLLLIAAFTWRAALLVSTDRHPARSTCSAFAINSINNKLGDCSATIAGKRFVCLEEYTFINCRHLAHISTAIRNALSVPNGDGTAFADLHIMLSGDVCQHTPVTGRPLFVGQRDRGCRLSAEEVVALEAFDKFDRVVMLTQQQRITATQDPLYHYSRLFIRQAPPDKSEIAAFCDALNEKVVTPAEFQQWAAAGRVPRVVCLRNDVRKQLNWALARLHARYLKVRPIVWFAHDIVSPGQGHRLPADDLTDAACAVPNVVKRALACMKPEDTQHVGSMQIFFPGCIYLFNDNVAPQVGMVNNGECVGVDVLLHEDEADDGQHECWFLKRPPAAIFVRPLDSKVSTATWQLLQQTYPTLPAGCLPVVPGWTDTFTVKYFRTANEATDGAAQGEVAATIKVRRFGFSLSDGYAVTDYYCQGVNFKANPWLAHLNPPPNGRGLQRPTLFVVLTRWSAWADVRLLCPLWPAGDLTARQRVIDTCHALACLEPALKDELTRLHDRAATARVTYDEQWARAQAATA
jgi:hypothetical protein